MAMTYFTGGYHRVCKEKHGALFFGLSGRKRATRADSPPTMFDKDNQNVDDIVKRRNVASSSSSMMEM